jgi:hypothetical protein
MIVVLHPTCLGNRSFDPISQTFHWETLDVSNEVLTLSLPFRDWNQQSIRRLEELSPPEGFPWRLIVRLTYEGEELSVEPISILRPEVKTSPVFQLAFDSFGDEEIKAPVPAATSADESDFEDIDSTKGELTSVGEPFVPATVALGGVLTEVNSRLLAVAETGAQKGLASHRQWFSQSTGQAYALGLTALARSLSSLAHENSTAAVVLRTRYLTYLHAQAISHLFP